MMLDISCDCLTDNHIAYQVLFSSTLKTDITKFFITALNKFRLIYLRVASNYMISRSLNVASSADTD